MYEGFGSISGAQKSYKLKRDLTNKSMVQSLLETRVRNPQQWHFLLVAFSVVTKHIYSLTLRDGQGSFTRAVFLELVLNSVHTLSTAAKAVYMNQFADYQFPLCVVWGFHGTC